MACFAIAVLLGCAKESPAAREAELYVPIPRAEKESVAASFPIFDARSGSFLPPRTPNGALPFGVILTFLNHQKLGMCTVSHWRGTEVVTNAHCLEDIVDPGAFYVVFVDQELKHRYAEVTKIGYVGNRSADDVAVLRLDPTDAVGWDELNPSLKDSSGFIGKSLGRGNFPVTLWAFDPVSSHPEYSGQLTEDRGGVFVPKNCTGFRTLPEAGIEHSNGDKEAMPDGAVDVTQHVLLDRCDRDPIRGNSGSWISAQSDPGQGYGVFHWLITGGTLSAEQDAKNFYYTGSSGHELFFPATDGFSFYFVGTDLFRVLSNHPGAF